LTPTMAGRDCRGGARVSLARRKEGTQVPDNRAASKFTLDATMARGDIRLFVRYEITGYNETDRVEIRRLTSSRRTAARFSVSPAARPAPDFSATKNEGPKREISPAAIGRG